MAEKVEQLRAQCNTACKLTYMVCYGNDAVEKYAKDLNDYFIALDDARQGREPVETEQAPERENDLFAVISKEQEREELLKTNEAIKTTELYRMTSVSNYGLWGKWYDSGNGWHRGIDICPGGNVHVIWPGELVDIGSAGGTPYYLSLFSEDLGVTITYMHLAIGTHADGTAFQVGDHFEIGAVLGTQSNRLTKGSHTHIEINQGVYRSGEETFGIGNGVIRPMSTDGEGMYTNLPLAEISEGVNMSINPYPYLDRIWKSRSQMQ